MNKFNTYVINLENDKKKWNIMLENFKDTGIKLNRFDAIYGKTVDKSLKKKYASGFCDNFCPNAVVGCGLSHIMLNEQIINNDKNSFALICEDDVKPIVKNLGKNILDLVNKIPNNWDVIKLIDQGFCGSKSKYEYNDNILSKLYPCGSTAGYLVSKKGSEKISKLKLINHFDIQIDLDSNIKIYKSPINFLETSMENSSTSEKNFLTKLNLKKDKKLKMPISFYLNEKILKIFNYEITFFHLLIIGLILSFIYKKVDGIKYYLTIILFWFLIGYFSFTD
jgi:GR25 family glycosyltransferase involved in LPS biosynthesis